MELNKITIPQTIHGTDNNKSILPPQFPKSNLYYIYFIVFIRNHIYINSIKNTFIPFKKMKKGLPKNSPVGFVIVKHPLV